MPRYLMERLLPAGWDEADLHQAARHSQQVREERFHDIAWEHSHVVRVAGGGLKAFCIYDAPDEQRVRAHAEASGLPADEVHELHTDLLPDAPS